MGNLAILAATVWAKRTTPPKPLPAVDGTKHLHAVDAGLWRGSAPSRDGYATLADRGVRVIVDLRAEEHRRVDEAFLAGLGVELVRIPIRDGQTPTTTQVEQFFVRSRTGDGIVFVHCGAGVGRTGTVVGAHLVRTGSATPGDALRRNLAVGPPSLEQIWYVARLGHGFTRPNIVVRALSRTLDAPRRLWSRLRS